jgi:NAD(P)-dependent dehydrogenase (short-subunit alcohol dehydrogenase family)
MDFGLRNRIAYVSGGSKGMGGATAEMLAAEGCRVAIVARDRANIDRQVGKIRAQGGEAIGIVADVTDEAAVIRAVAQVREAYGPPEIAIAMSNDMRSGNFLDVPSEDFQKVFQALTMSIVYLAKAVIPAMREAGWGRIVHIGSTTAKEPDRGIAHVLHNTARASGTSLLKVLSNEFSRDGITVNAVGPGHIITDTMQDYLEEKYDIPRASIDEWIRTSRDVPAERAGLPEEVAALVVFLCSRQASYITGQLVAADGGGLRSAV